MSGKILSKQMRKACQALWEYFCENALRWLLGRLRQTAVCDGGLLVAGHAALSCLDWFDGGSCHRDGGNRQDGEGIELHFDGI